MGLPSLALTFGYPDNDSHSIHNNPQGATTQPLIIYIHSPTPGNSIKLSSVPNALLNYTVIQINPRWSPTHLFPTPIHDTLHAYHWILENITKNTAKGRPRPIAVYGTKLGGTLATSLALTESRPSLHRPNISVLAVKNAIFDWSKIASSPPPSDPPLPQDPDLQQLYSLRSQLFCDPASAFDAFASPLLFFRTTGLAIPSAFPKVASSPSQAQAEAAQEGAGAGAFVSRKSHLTFPPKRSGLRIPVTRIAVTADGKTKWEGKGKGKGKGKRKGEEHSGVLREQAGEMVALMRRSVVLHEGKERRFEGLDVVAEAERRVALVELGSGDGEVDDGEWAAEYFEEVLGK
jgi:alpha/beta hydrolase fold